MPDNKKVLGLNPPAGWGLSVWILHVVSMSAWVLAGYSDFSPHTKDVLGLS